MNASRPACDFDAPGSRRSPWLRRVQRRFRGNWQGIAIALLVVMFAAVLLAPRMLVTIPPGRYGVLWLRFQGGTVTDRALGEGLRVILPWNRIYIYDGRLLAHHESYDAVTRDGLSMRVDVTFRWRVLPSTVGFLQRDVGPDYLHVLLVPEVGSTAREVISRYLAQDMISGFRAEIQDVVFRTVLERPNMVLREGTAPARRDTYVALRDVLISTIVLPEAVRIAIERKLQQAQVAKEYKYRIETERLESERKAIEAQGIKTFQQTVQTGISETYLKWRGIEATLELARSPNAKTIVIGGGGNGLPLILNTGGDSKLPPGPDPGAPKAPVPPPIEAKSDPKTSDGFDVLGRFGERIADFFRSRTRERP